MPDVVPLSAPVLEGNEWKYIRSCLDSGWVSTAGSFVTRFETELAGYVGAAHGVACTNGTAALHVALMMLGVAPGDLVLAPALTFIAPINTIRYCGADPLFCDCDSYYNIDPGPVREFLASGIEMRGGCAHDRLSGRRVSALLTVAVFGNAGDWPGLYADCRERGIAIVEDATEALGTRYTSGAWAGRHAGTVGDLGCFSFNGNKIITTGGGGMIVTDDPEMAKRARYLTQQAKDDPIAYRHDEVGFNYRMTNVAAAMGVAQLENLEEFVARKQANFERYREVLADLDWCEMRSAPPWARNNLWMYALYIRAGVWRGRVRELVDAMWKEGIETRPVWRLNHLQRPYGDCRVLATATAVDLAANTINLPCSVNLSPESVARVREAIGRV